MLCANVSIETIFEARRTLDNIFIEQCACLWFDIA